MKNYFSLKIFSKLFFFHFFSFFQNYQKITVDKGRISPEASGINKRSRLFFKDLYFFNNIYIYIIIYIYICF